MQSRVLTDCVQLQNDTFIGVIMVAEIYSHPFITIFKIFCFSGVNIAIMIGALC